LPIKLCVGTIKRPLPIKLCVGTIKRTLPIKLRVGTIKRPLPIKLRVGTIKRPLPSKLRVGTYLFHTWIINTIKRPLPRCVLVCFWGGRHERGQCVFRLRVECVPFQLTAFLGAAVECGCLPNGKRRGELGTRTKLKTKYHVNQSKNIYQKKNVNRKVTITFDSIDAASLPVSVFCNQFVWTRSCTSPDHLSFNKL